MNEKTNPACNLPIQNGSITMPKVSQFFENREAHKDGRPPFLEYFVTKEQLSGSLALSPSYISKLMATDGLPHFKIGRAVRFRVSEVVAWLQKRRQP